jgi:hypothetical protein
MMSQTCQLDEASVTSVLPLLAQIGSAGRASHERANFQTTHCTIRTLP